MAMRTATESELATILDWAAAEGWNPGLDDAGPFHATDPQGVFVADEAGVPVAAISVMNHSPDFAFLGLYIVRPEWRGRGIGHALWRHAIAHAGTRTIGLDGVAAQQANYARSGFVPAGSSVRFEGRLAAAEVAAVRDAGPGDAATLSALDAAACGVQRPAFLRAWTRPDPTRRTVIGVAGQGFATVRRCRSGVKIGPVIAPDAEAALALARAALARVEASPVFIDLPPGQTAFARLLASEGFRPVFETARMYRGRPPAVSPTLQAIATMELG